MSSTEEVVSGATLKDAVGIVGPTPASFGGHGADKTGASLAVGAAEVMVMARSTAEIRIIGPLEAQSIARGGDVARMLIIVLLFVIFGPFIGIALITWAALRELGLFKARDAHLYIDTKNVDVISYEAGALILDVHARGTFVGKN